MQLGEAEKADVLERLKKVEGQVRGIQRMIDADRYCVDVLTQVAAARAALYKVGLTVLEGHTRGCVTSAIRSGQGDAAIEELVAVLMKFSG